jgi:hypothetical protein
LTPETPLPPQLKAIIGRGLNLVKDPAERAELRPVVDAIAETTFDRWLSRRAPEDNRPEHEFVVFGAAMAIAEAERLPYPASWLWSAPLFCTTPTRSHGSPKRRFEKP